VFDRNLGSLKSAIRTLS